MIVEIYQTANGRVPFTDWLIRLGKPDRLRIQERIRRIEIGHFGDHKPVGDGVWELRFGFGAGYRVYFGMEGDTIVLLLYGGDKDSQSRDIDRAKSYWQDYKESKQ